MLYLFCVIFHAFLKYSFQLFLCPLFLSLKFTCAACEKLPHSPFRSKFCACTRDQIRRHLKRIHGSPTFTLQKTRFISIHRIWKKIHLFFLNLRSKKKFVVSGQWVTACGTSMGEWGKKKAVSLVTSTAPIGLILLCYASFWIPKEATLCRRVGRQHGARSETFWASCIMLFVLPGKDGRVTGCTEPPPESQMDYSLSPLLLSSIPPFSAVHQIL